MRRQVIIFLFALLLCVLVFIGDLLVVRGYVEWLLYIVPLLLIYLAGRTGLTYMLLGVIGILLGIGYRLSPDPGIPPLVSLADRIEGFIVFAAYTVIVNALIRSRKAHIEARTSAERNAGEIAAINKELEAFSYSVSHDLRNPLQAISSFTELLRKEYGECLEGDGMEYIRRIDTGVTRMGQLIDDMLSLSRVSRQDLHREEFDLSAMASTILEELNLADPHRPVAWRVQEAIHVHADPRLMHIALANLLGNAWKYTAKTDGATIDVGVRNREGRRVYFVRDNGAGFDMSRADSIFAPFRRLHSEREFSGTGIGLAIVERIIQRHEGEVWAESRIGQGATFYFTLE
jgi:light-regulated signal transduction histidine kinase (bacteriophytochrome)